MAKTYECEICQSVVSTARLHCPCCGTVPGIYSWNGKPYRERRVDYRFTQSEISSAIEVVVAYGAELQTRYRTVKHALRSVPADYYAEV